VWGTKGGEDAVTGRRGGYNGQKKKVLHDGELLLRRIGGKGGGLTGSLVAKIIARAGFLTVEKGGGALGKEKTNER